MTYPLILALERDRSTEPLLREVLATSEASDADHARFAEIVRVLESCGALADCRALAESHAAKAIAMLDSLPAGRATDALVTVAEATVSRRA